MVTLVSNLVAYLSPIWRPFDWRQVPIAQVGGVRTVSELTVEVLEDR